MATQQELKDSNYTEADLNLVFRGLCSFMAQPGISCQ